MRNFDFLAHFSSKEVRPIVKRTEGKIGFGIGVDNVSPFDSPEKMELIEEVGMKKHGSKEIKCEYILKGLKIGVDYQYFPEGNALSLRGKIYNNTNEPVSHLFRISSFLQNFSIERSDRVRIHSFKGGIWDLRYPPVAFTHSESELISWISEHPRHHSSVQFHGGLRGLSTENDMPYLVVQIGEQGGIFFVLEWPGDWSSYITREAGGEKLVCEIGLEHLDLNLLPKEALPLPGCLIGFYQGDWIEGCNALKKTIVEYYIPKLKGAPVVPPVFYDQYFGLGINCGEEKMRRIAEVASQIECEYFVLDAGWYAGCGMEGHNPEFFQGIGNWQTPHPEKYPNGLKPLSQFVDERGMRFGLWIEPERCDRGSSLAKNHPDWVIPDPKGGFQNLVDFGNPEVVSWFKDTFDKIIQENKIEWIRFDSNIEPYHNWKKKDVPGRKGILQIRHFEGLFNFWDHLLEQHPNLLIEGCAGGGRRMDLACLKRSHTYWCNDLTEYPDMTRWHKRANLIIPANYLSHTLVLKTDKVYPGSVYHCLFGGTLGFADDLTMWSQEKIKSAAEHVKIFKEFRPLLMKDFSPLFDAPYSLDCWDGWQWHDRKKHEGIIIVFRVLSPEPTKTIKLRWIDKNRNYELLDLYSREKKKMAGKELSLKGLVLNLMPRGSVVIRYAAIH